MITNKAYMKTYVTLNAINKHNPNDIYNLNKLLNHLGKTQPDDEPVDILEILKSNDAPFTFRYLRAVDDTKKVMHFALECALMVKPLMLDAHSLKALETAEQYLVNDTTEKELRRTMIEAYKVATNTKNAASCDSKLYPIYAAYAAAYAADGDAPAAAFAAATAFSEKTFIDAQLKSDTTYSNDIDRVTRAANSELRERQKLSFIKIFG